MPTRPCPSLQHHLPFHRAFLPLIAAILPIHYGPAFSQVDDGTRHLQMRVQALESQTQALRQELEFLREQPVQPAAMGIDSATVAGDSREALRQEMSKLAWRKGDFTITPYGRVVVSTAYETERSYPGDIILWAQSPDVQGEHAYYVDAKSTRLGMRVAGPGTDWCPTAQLGACVEIDFQGHYVTHNKPGLLFRRGFIDVKDDDFYLLFGHCTLGDLCSDE